MQVFKSGMYSIQWLLSVSRQLFLALLNEQLQIYAMQKHRMILLAVDTFCRGFQYLLSSCTSSCNSLSVVRAATTSSQLSVSDLMQMAAFGPLGSNRCPTIAIVHSLWETGGGTEWEQATGCQLDQAEDAPPQKYPLSHSPSLSLDLHLLLCVMF